MQVETKMKSYQTFRSQGQGIIIDKKYYFCSNIFSMTYLCQLKVLSKNIQVLFCLKFKFNVFVT